MSIVDVLVRFVPEADILNSLTLYFVLIDA